MSEKTAPVQSKEQVTMAKGMAWLTAGNFISRLLGIVYIIPWYAWMGENAAEANALSNMGYQVYAGFLLISTVGLPTAVAKQISKYNILGQKDTSYYLVREIFKLMIVLGAVFAGLMYLFSPALAEMSGSKDQLTPVMYSLVPNLFIFPAMSIMRGFFQGHHDMKPYALSQIAEQFVRVIWILVTTYYIMKLGSGNYLEAVVQSTFAAFVGMIASVAVLVYILHKEGFLPKIFRKKPDTVTVDLKSLIIETIKEAIPLIILGSAFQFFQLIDQGTFVNFLNQITTYSKDELLTLYSYMLPNPSKITMIIIGVTGSLGNVAIPLITERFVQKDKKGTAALILDNLELLVSFVIPAIIGAILLARPLYTVFYGQTTDMAIWLFIINLILIFVQGFYSVLGVVIQAIFETRKAILYFTIGLIAKLVLQIPCLYLFQVYGSLVSTAIGLTVTVVLFYNHIHQVVPIDQKAFYRYSLQISVISLVLALVVLVSEFLLNRLVPLTGTVSSAIHLVVSGGLGSLVFVVLTLKTRQLDKLIGGQATVLRKKLHIS